MIDLANRSNEVAKLMWAGFGHQIVSQGYDPDDVLQEVYRGLLARNRGKSPWDESRSSFGHYVHMVIGCVLRNYHRKQQRLRSRERVGLPGYEGGEWKDQDVSCKAKSTSVDMLVGLSEAQEDLCDYMRSLDGGRDAELAEAVLPLKTLGLSRKEMAAQLGATPTQVSRGLSFLRKAARQWGARAECM